MARDRTSHIGSAAFLFDSQSEAKTLEQLLKEEKDGKIKQEKELKELRKKTQEEVVKAQEIALKNMYLDLAAKEKEYQLAGIKDIERIREKLRKEAIEKEQRDRTEKLKEFYKKELEEIKKSRKSLTDRISDAQNKYKANREDLDLLDIMRRNGEISEKDYKQRKKSIEAENKKLNQDVATMSIQKGLITALKGLTDSVNSNMKTYTELQRGTNARLQGTQVSAADRLLGLTKGISQFDRFGLLENRLSMSVGINPYFRTETMLTNLSNLINEGIASNVEQRAFLATASENIANTFDVANGALLRIIRLQQQDSTAARLGMEAYLTRFLNNLVDNTEYLSKTFDSVQDALVEMSSQMSTQASTELEYVIQKWLGALVGVGMSDTTATNIAQAIGYLGSGNVEALSGSNLQNLLVMAASRSNLSYSDLLTSGLSAQSADALMKSLVDYMIEIGKSGNNVVKSQFASTFGISYSDLAAAANLAPSLGSLYGNRMSFGDMYGELWYQMSQIPLRMNMATMIDNLWENMEFGVGKSIASNPALAAIWKVTDLIQQNTGGIPIPFITAAGFGTDLNATVEQLIKLGVVGTSSLGMIGDLISGLSTSFAPGTALSKLGIFSGNTSIRRGSGLGTTSSGLSTSVSGARTVGNASGMDIQQSALASAREEAQSNAASNPEEEEMKRANINIYKYLTDTFDKKMDSLVSSVEDIRRDVDELNFRTFGTLSTYGNSEGGLV